MMKSCEIITQHSTLRNLYVANVIVAYACKDCDSSSADQNCGLIASELKAELKAHLLD